MEAFSLAAGWPLTFVVGVAGTIILTSLWCFGGGSTR